MKYCENCGTQLADADEFCFNCGARQNSAYASIQQQVPVQQVPVQQAAPMQQQVLMQQPVKRKANKKIIIPLVVIVIAIIVATVTYSQLRKRVNLNKYITVEYSGYNTVGRAYYTIDREGLEKAIVKAQGKKETQMLSGSALDDAVYMPFVQCVNISVDNNTDLSNGDTVILKIECNEYADTVLGVKFIYKNEEEHKVENLEEPKRVNIFDDVSVSFSGTSPNAKATVNNSSSDSYLSRLNFKLSKSSGIKTGDKVTVTVSYNEKEALSNGYILTETSKEYTCDKLDAYISSVEELTSEKQEELKKTAKDKIEAYCAQNNLSESNLNYAGAYTLVSKSSSSYYSGSNMVYEIYSADITAKRGYSGSETETKSVYMAVCISNVLLKSDGTVSYSSSMSMSSGRTSVGNSYVYGYASGEELYRSLITKQKDSYTYKVSGDIKKFGE